MTEPIDGWSNPLFRALVGVAFGGAEVAVRSPLGGGTWSAVRTDAGGAVYKGAEHHAYTRDEIRAEAARRGIPVPVEAAPASQRAPVTTWSDRLFHELVRVAFETPGPIGLSTYHVERTTSGAAVVTYAGARHEYTCDEIRAEAARRAIQIPEPPATITLADVPLEVLRYAAWLADGDEDRPVPIGAAARIGEWRAMLTHAVDARRCTLRQIRDGSGVERVVAADELAAELARRGAPAKSDAPATLTLADIPDDLWELVAWRHFARTHWKATEVPAAPAISAATNAVWVAYGWPCHRIVRRADSANMVATDEFVAAELRRRPAKCDPRPPLDLAAVSDVLLDGAISALVLGKPPPLLSDVGHDLAGVAHDHGGPDRLDVVAIRRRADGREEWRTLDELRREAARRRGAAAGVRATPEEHDAAAGSAPATELHAQIRAEQLAALRRRLTATVTSGEPQGWATLDETHSELWRRAYAALDETTPDRQDDEREDDMMDDGTMGLVATAAEDVSAAATRVAALQFLRLARDNVAALLARHLAPGDEALRGRIAEFLRTDLGMAMVAGTLSIGLTLMPGGEGVAFLPSLRRELRVSAMAGAGDAVAEALMAPLREATATWLRALPAPAAPEATGVRAVPAPEPAAAGTRIAAAEDVLDARRAGVGRESAR